MKKKILEAALGYQKMGFSVIPIRKDKKPYIKWELYQSERVGQDQIHGWWKRWPNANIGLVTGEVSGIDVVDCDSEKGRDALNELLSDTIIIPISKTPKGWHYFFKHSPGLSNGVRVITDCDLRTNGGYVIAPTSVNGDGKPYAWMPGLSISEVKPAVMPEMLFDILQAGGMPASSSKDEHKKGSIPLYKKNPYIEGQHCVNNSEVNTRSTRVNKVNITFDEGGRDESLFHLSNYLVKAGMPEKNIRKYLYFFASNCNPPFPEKEINAKIESALNREKGRSDGLTAEIREIIESTQGNISSTFIYQMSTKSTSPSDKRKISAILGRFVKEGFIERVGNQNGVFRRIESDIDPEDWQNACTDTVDLWLPFDLNEMIEIPPGNIILFAGSQDAGKSAIQMNIAKENRFKWNVHYFSSELNAGAFKNRMNKFPDLDINQCPIKFYSHSTNFHDVIKTGENDLNIIDYLEVHDHFYKVSEYLSQIHRKLDQAICVVALQKDPNALYGRGGSFTQEKPILSISLDHGKATISKFKGEFQGENPRGKEYHFKLIDGCRFREINGWHKPIKGVQ